MIGILVISDGLLVAIVVWALAGLAVTLWAVVDAVSTPSVTFRAAGSSKAMWIALITGLYVLTVYPGIVMAVVYLSVIRRRLRRAPQP